MEWHNENLEMKFKYLALADVDELILGCHSMNLLLVDQQVRKIVEVDQILTLFM